MVYVYQPTNPLQSFAEGYQVVDAMRQRRQEVEQQQAKQQQQAAFVQDVNAWQQNPTREGWANLQVRYPQLAQTVKPLAELYGEQGKGAIIDVGTRFLTAQGDARAAVLDQAIAAAENSRLPDVVQVLKNARELYSVDPKAAEAAVRVALIREDGDTYDKLFAPAKLAPTLQEYSQRVEMFGQKAADAWLSTQDTKLIAANPGGKVYEFGPGMVAVETGQVAPADQPIAPRPPAATLTLDQFRANAQVLGPERASKLLTNNGMAVRVRSPQEANSLPKGTLYATPDGEVYTR